MKFTAIIVFFCFLFVRCTSNTEVDLIVYNAKVYTVDSTFSIKEAFAVKNGIFIDIGTTKNILKRYRAKESVDAQQKPVFPGFYDAHAHTFLLADLFQQVDLNTARSLKEVIDRVRDFKKKHPNRKWIVGGGWDQNKWEDKNTPTKDSLDKYFPETPVYLARVDYHAALVNSAALKIARIDTAYAIEGGLIQADSVGMPTGYLLDNAAEMMRKFITTNEDHHILADLKQMQDSLFSVGLTSVVDAGLTAEQIELLKKFYLQDSLKIRNYAMIYAHPHQIDNYIKEGIYESDRFNVKSIKLFADGALGSHGACLLAPYSDNPHTKGMLLHSPEELDETIKKLAKSKFQVNTHAIGDSANRFILDVYGKYLTDNKKRRWRIEHAQVIAPEDFAKFRAFHIMPSVQPTHATSDMGWITDRIGQERSKGAYAYKQLLKQYGKIALGSDFPIEHFNPLNGFYAAVARRDFKGLPKDGFQMENALSREEALRGMTIWAAYSCFQEKKRGSIEKGKDADFVVLDQDIMEVDLTAIKAVKTLRTVIAGETVFILKQ